MLMVLQVITLGNQGMTFVNKLADRFADIDAEPVASRPVELAASRLVKLAAGRLVELVMHRLAAKC